MASNGYRRVEVRVSSSWRRGVPLTLFASLSVLSCSSGSSNPSPTSAAVATSSAPPISYGAATIQPQTVKRGGSITVTPATEIQPICLGLAMVRSALNDHEPIVQLGGGWWVSYETTQPTWPACLPPRSSASADFAIADDFPEGTYVVCLTDDLTEDGCGTMTIVAS